MLWHFSPLLADQVEAEVTQRDQFDNDQVDISETIVREAVQNSLDAAIDDSSQVTVTFKLLTTNNGLTPEYMRDLLEGQLLHAEAAGLDLQNVDFNQPSALIIEDFGTKGLTGSTTSKDSDNFSDFWRRHGKSHKTGKSRGRWGLGKLVYSCTSLAGVFFGVTRRIGDEGSHMLGQTVLNLREVDGKTYPPHGYYCDLENEHDLSLRIPVPIKDAAFVQNFSEHFALNRADGPGLSVVIPFPNPDFNIDRMIGIAIHNYFYPVITKKLVLKFNQLVVTSENVRELAHKYARDYFDQIDVLFDFIEEASSTKQEELLHMRDSWAEDAKLDEDDFDEKDVEQIRERFSSGEIVGLHLPIKITKKDGTRLSSNFSVFIKRPQELEKGLDLYVRGGLTLPGEAKFRERRALAVLVADEEAICSFLGDAENAAHTLWTSNTEKLRKNYRSNQTTVAVIKKALVQLYDLLAEVTDEKDEDALNQFFWFDEPEKKKAKRKKKPVPPEPPPTLPKPEPKLKVNKLAGGFSIESATGLTAEDLPKEIRVKVAYDVARGNSFKNWSRYDFDVGDNIEYQLGGNLVVVAAEGQEWILEARSLDFRFSANGFDQNRDLKVRVS